MRTLESFVRDLSLLGTAVAVLSARAPGQTELFQIDGSQAGGELGTAVAVIGDLDGDGADDFAVGAPRENARAGVVRVHSGRTGVVLQTLNGVGPDDFFGQAIEALGDVDGDQVGDFAVGAPELEFEPGDCGYFAGFGPAFGSGYVIVFSGLSLAPLYTISGSSPDSGFGFELGAGGDVNGGGPDLIVCGGKTGLATVHEGVDGAPIRVHDFSPGFGFSYSAAIVGDTNGDGLDEYALGTVEYVFCYSGQVELRDGAGGGLLWFDFLCGPGDEYGFQVARAGDLDGDDLPDVLGCGLDDSGLACVDKSYARGLSAVDGTPFWTSVGGNSAARGRALEGLGDLDGDGEAEVALGQPGLHASGAGGAVLVLSGSAGALALAIPPDAPEDKFGCALASGDVNGDGLLDLLVGARRDDDGGADAGSVRAFSVFLGPTTYCEAQTNSQGCQPTVFSTGVPSLTVNNFRVKAAGILNNKNGLLFYGASPKQSPFSGGFKCVAAPTARTPVQQSGGNPPPSDCSGTFAFHFNKAYLTSKGLGAGDALFCQYWSRDPAAASTTNLTDALAFEILP